MSDPTFLPAISFRPFGEDNLPRLVGWLRAPHVAAWWQRMTPAEIEAKYQPRLRGETSVRVYAVLAGSEPIGMVQAAPVQGSPGACNIDVLIGEAAWTGVGLGPHILDDFTTNEVFGRLGFSTCLADPAAGNRRSIRAFEKAGFTRVRSAEIDGQTISLMVRERHPRASERVRE